MNYVITCTSGVDLTKEMLASRNIKCAYYKVIVDDNTYEDNFFEDYPYDKFYEDIRNGKEPKSSQYGYGPFLEFFENILKEGKDILHISLSSGISGDYDTACMVAQELNEKYENKIYVIDSLGASSGYGMVTILAADNKDKGMNIKDNIIWLEENKYRLNYWFVSSDLSAYVRGGRISKAEGLVGSALKICPLMTMPADGTLKPVEKIRTESKAFKAQLEKMIELADNGLDYDNYCWISTSHYEEKAHILADMIKEKFHNIKEVKIFKIGCAVGCHSGYGTVSLYFIGKSRK